MRLLDRDIQDCKAMVIDPNPTSRSILVSQLRDFGVADVTQSSKIADARKHLELRTFDLVLCEREFHEGGYSGQNLLDDLRRNQMLPLSTVFIMVTSAASYSVVAEAAESALDGYLLKPFTATALGERISQARARKKALADIFNAIEAQDFDGATRLCLRRFASRQQYWLYAARIGSELLLRQGHHDTARKLYEAVLETGALPWAKLGIARAQIESNQPLQAIRTLESLIGEHPTYVDAYDVMGRVQVEQGDFEQALATYRQATQMTPGSLTRLQKLGMLAFYAGARDEAAKMLDRAASLGISSKMFDYQSLVVLAFCRFQQKDAKGLQRCEDNLQHTADRAPDSVRLRRFTEVVKVLNLLLQRQVSAAAAAAKRIGAELREADFDIEAAANVVALLAQVSSSELQLGEASDWIDLLGMRYASTRSLTELLTRSAAAHPPYAEQLQACHQKLSELAEESVTFSLRGYHRKSVEMLLAHGETTLNPKLIETARLMLERHGDKIDDVRELSLRMEHLRNAYCNGPLMPSLGNTSRQAGAIALREGRPSTTEPRVPSSVGDVSALVRKMEATLPVSADSTEQRDGLEAA